MGPKAEHQTIFQLLGSGSLCLVANPASARQADSLRSRDRGHETSEDLDKPSVPTQGTANGLPSIFASEWITIVAHTQSKVIR